MRLLVRIRCIFIIRKNSINRICWTQAGSALPHRNLLNQSGVCC